eukprot:13677770-Alexandrium_andersonii.AAC.1
MAFWSCEVIAKAPLFATQAKRPGELASEGTALELNKKGVSAEQVAVETLLVQDAPAHLLRRA